MKNYASFIFRFLAGTFFLFSFAFAQTPPPAPGVLNVVPGDRMITVSWQEVPGAAGYKVFYGTSSVKNPSQSYEYETILSGRENTSYIAYGLFNNLQYYFAVKSIASDGTLSLQYSPEATAVPLASDKLPPQVLGVSQISSNKIQVSFSKDVVLRDVQNAFFVREKYSASNLPISSIESFGRTVYLSFPDNVLISGRTYVVTATSLVEDLNGVSVSSGMMDHAEFIYDFSSSGTASQQETFVSSVGVPQGLEPPSSPLSPEQLSSLQQVAQGIYGSAPSNQDSLATNQNVASAPLTGSFEVSGITLDSTFLKDKKMVSFSWKLPDAEISDQILFVRLKGGTWDSGLSLGGYVNYYEVPVELNKQYELKIVTVDALGNKSNGTVFKFTTYLLPKSGPLDLAAVIGLLLLLFWGAWYFRKNEV